VGFFRRNDLRWFYHETSYSFWPESKSILNITPGFLVDQSWDHAGKNIYTRVHPSLAVNFRNQTSFSFWYETMIDGLRPIDFPSLMTFQRFHQNTKGFQITSNTLKQVAFQGLLAWGSQLNYVPPAGEPPFLANYTYGEFALNLRPVSGLIINNSYLLNRNVNRANDGAIYNSHIIRSKWIWQVNRELTVRFIGQYDGSITNKSYTSQSTRRNFNADMLITYLVHPGTAVYLGYNSNLRRPGLPIGGHSPDRFINDGRQLFMKVSYLFRF
jgi:hypothetical protein